MNKFGYAIWALNEPAAGALKRAFPDADVWCLTHRPVFSGKDRPLSNLVTEYGSPVGVSLEDWELRGYQRSHLAWKGFLNKLDGYVRIEIWVDSVPNSQLLYYQLLSKIAGLELPGIQVLVCEVERPLGAELAENIPSLRTRLVQVSNDTTLAADNAWSAFNERSPEAWSVLAHNRHLPALGELVVNTLSELPQEINFLSKTQTDILNLLLRTPAFPLGEIAQKLPNPLKYTPFEVFEILDSLASCAVPAVQGTNSSWDLRRLQDPNYLKSFLNAHVSLTPFGESLVCGAGDFSERNRVNRWWGGMLITNDFPWRWAPEAQILTVKKPLL